MPMLCITQGVRNVMNTRYTKCFSLNSSHLRFQPSHKAVSTMNQNYLEHACNHHCHLLQYDTLMLQQVYAAFGSRSRLGHSLTPNLLLTRSPEKVDPRYVGTVMARWPEATVSYSGKGSGLGPNGPTQCPAAFPAGR